jgi:DNA replication protein DnaC
MDASQPVSVLKSGIYHLIPAVADHSLLKKLQFYQSPDLLVVDEMGYLSLGQQGAHGFFHASVKGRNAHPP